MHKSWCQKLLLPTLVTVILLGSVGVAAAGSACPVVPEPPCGPPAFTGVVIAQVTRCVAPKPPVCWSAPGRKGARGRTGTRGETGRRGVTGAAGPRGVAGKTGATGLQGVVGNTGAPGPEGATGATGQKGATGSPGSTGALGLQGNTGSTGPAGATGTTGAGGAMGLQGVQGNTGAAGPVGPPGSPGSAGSAGSTGSIGPAGATGAIGPSGADGASGPAGNTGSTGPAGNTGSTGATGPAGATGTNGLADYAYVYNQAAQVVPVEGAISFDTNGVMTAGITHATPSAGITFVDAGTYKVTFSVSGTGPNQVALFLNGTVVDGSIYGSGAGTQQNVGQVLIVASAGDVLTLENHSSTAALDLATTIGGTQANVNASVSVERLQ